MMVVAPDCLYYMQTGSELIKVRPNGRQYHRLFTLDSSLGEIRWHPSSKKPQKAKRKLFLFISVMQHFMDLIVIEGVY